MKCLRHFESEVEISFVSIAPGSEIWIVVEIIAKYTVAVIYVLTGVEDVMMPYFIHF